MIATRKSKPNNYFSLCNHSRGGRIYIYYIYIYIYIHDIQYVVAGKTTHTINQWRTITLIVNNTPKTWIQANKYVIQLSIIFRCFHLWHLFESINLDSNSMNLINNLLKRTIHFSNIDSSFHHPSVLLSWY
jgi:hypothetical protein